MSDLKFAKPPKREKKKSKGLRYKSETKGQYSEIKKDMSAAKFGVQVKEKKEKPKYSSLQTRTPLTSKSSFKKDDSNEEGETSSLRPRKRINAVSKKKRPRDEELEALKSQMAHGASKRVVDRKAMDECRALPCVITGKSNPKDYEEYKLLHPLERVDPCHVKSRGSGGSDVWWDMVPMLRRFHSEQEAIGWKAFSAKYPKAAEALHTRGWYWDVHGNMWNEHEQALLNPESLPEVPDDQDEAV